MHGNTNPWLRQTARREDIRLNWFLFSEVIHRTTGIKRHGLYSQLLHPAGAQDRQATKQRGRAWPEGLPRLSFIPLLPLSLAHSLPSPFALNSKFRCTWCHTVSTIFTIDTIYTNILTPWVNILQGLINFNYLVFPSPLILFIVILAAYLTRIIFLNDCVISWYHCYCS